MSGRIVDALTFPFRADWPAYVWWPIVVVTVAWYLRGHLRWV